MDEGASKGLFILVAIIIFGIFVVIAYWLFEEQIKAMLDNMLGTANDVVEANLNTITTP